MDHVEPGNPKKAAFILQTDETIGMLRASESHSLFIKVIQRVASFQKGTVNMCSRVHLQPPQMQIVVTLRPARKTQPRVNHLKSPKKTTTRKIASISAFNLLCG